MGRGSYSVVNFDLGHLLQERTCAVACICMFIDSTGIIAHLAGIIGPDLL